MTMQLGMIGLGRMGANMVRRLMKEGHRCVVYDRSADAVASLAKEGATGAGTLADLRAWYDERRGNGPGPAIPSSAACRARGADSRSHDIPSANASSRPARRWASSGRAC